MQISEAAAICGLSADTIRYYEKSGMLPEISRDTAGHRFFSKADLEWLTLLYWLRETGMAMKQMRRFTRLAKAGPKTVPERRQILMEHSEQLGERRKLLDRCEAVLAVKIASYQVSGSEGRT
jgi:DNA-binding transcriptional MerR regulator